ncbi:Gfo/Idh/MocA family protein [Aquibacillus salsiterrae]|uniref:Gfo/Idh/MocA family oxidoreductase n=1 Tax=Aquibacillus salsiterrae TaxID=2950439 RepID=A0A9X3WFG2_9BACI|nr:Gfo/Idh/MocA family oxidoreductase [Aquibacillus salsiterrae]MDC3418033.1 Gfo/Idh/MocA family oxidoreductase [Aquibacillus salsiterrae]
MNKVKVGFVGVGGIAAEHLKNIAQNQDADIVAVCDIVSESATKSGAQYDCQWYTDVDEMFHNEELDALFICVPPFAHGSIEERAAELGIHLMVEKPIGLELATVQSKHEKIKQANILCATGYCLRYLDTVAEAKRYLEDKEIAMVRGHYLTSFVPTPWYREMDKSGGQLVEQATHTLDLIRYLTGEMTSVYANMSLQVSEDIPGIDIPDVTSVNFTFANGAVGHLDSTFTQPDHRMGVEILGKDFRVVVDGVEVTIVEVGRTMTYKSKVNFYEEQDKAFIQAILTNNEDLILSNYENGLKTLGVTLAANESQQTGNPVQIKGWQSSLA